VQIVVVEIKPAQIQKFSEIWDLDQLVIAKAEVVLIINA
jgi:hypothetical protein